MSGGIGRDSKPEDPSGAVVVVASCATTTGTREVIAVCTAH
jgi:hypothetical protein